MKKIFAAFSIIFIMTAPTVFAGNTGSVNIEQTTAAGYDYSAAITEDGKLWMWGASFSGYLGFGGTDNVVIPTELMSEVISVYASSENSPPCTAVIKSDGTLWTWGDNYFGRLGDGTQTGRATPQQIMTGVKAASLGFKHTAAIKDDGSLWLWGLNNHGQLGDDTTGNNENPQKIMDHVKAVSAGFWHSAAVTDDGKLWTWGSNIRGQLGDGTNVDSHIPKMVMENVASVQASENFTAAIKTDGTLWMCGSNNNGQLGDQNGDSSVFKEVLSDVKSVSLGYRYVLAVKTNGELWGWGAGGALGDGQINAVNSPKKIMDGVNSVSAGYDHSLILKDDGTLLSCGRNYNGQLGDGNSETNNWTLTPSPVNLGSVKTIEEKKTYIVTFDPNGGDVDTKTITVTCGDEYGELPVPTRTGYTFEGWFTDDNVQIKDDTEVTITAPQTLHARWIANTYTITFDVAGGEEEVENTTVTYGDTYGELPVPTRTGYTFEGWFTDDNVQIKDDTEVTITAPQTLHAHWIANTYTITFDVAGGEEEVENTIVTYGDTYGELPVPTRTGYTFEGWFTDDNVQIKDDTEVTITAPQTLHAHWKANIYTITYDSNGGTGITADSVHIYDSERALTKNGFTKGNYAFMGWNTDPDGNGEFYADEAVVKNLASEDGSAVILYAQWERVGTKTTIEDRGEYTIVNVKITVVEPPCLIILSAYSDGCLAAVETRAYTSSDESFSIESDFDAVKVMLWNGLDRMDPISKVEIVEKY